jgi:hypothetical protein
MPALDPHEKPPEHVRAMFKKYQKASTNVINIDCDIVDFGAGHREGGISHEIEASTLYSQFRALGFFNGNIVAPDHLWRWSFEKLPGVLLPSFPL